MDKIWYDSRGILYTDQGILLCPYCPCVDESSSSSSGSSSSESSSSSSSSGWPPYDCDAYVGACTDSSWTDNCAGPTPPSACITTYSYTGGRHRSSAPSITYAGLALAYEASQIIGGATYRGFADSFVNSGTLRVGVRTVDGDVYPYATLAPTSTFYSMAWTPDGSTFYTHTASVVPALGDIMEIQIDIVRISETECEYTATARAIRGGSPLFEYTWSEVITDSLVCAGALNLIGPSSLYAEFDDIYLGST